MGRRTTSLQHDLLGLQSLNQIQNVKTQAQYKKEIRKFADFCKETLGVNKSSKLASYGTTNAIQAYADMLVAKDYTPNTIHTRVAAICRTLEVPMQDIHKPLRKASTIIRSREMGKNPQGDRELMLPKYQRLVEFQEKVGLRRSELARLNGTNLTYDESGNLCVEVLKGKSGKYQLQSIAKEDEDFIKAYFDGTTRKIFSSEEMNNKIDLHHMRAQNGQAKYNAYLEQCRTIAYRKELLQACIQRYKTYNGQRKGESKQAFHTRYKHFLSSLTGVYTLRGDNRRIALEKGYALHYDRLCLMAVSIFQLSHWRLNVTVTNYLLT